MKEFVSHIDYLIQKHDCVIIPDFGGFVISHEGASFTKDGSILPPRVTVGFNSGLKYNDGLLAESYMNMYSISYDEACKKVDEAIKRLNTILSMRHPVQIGRLGKLTLDKNNHLVFTPNENLSISHPETFGLSSVNMRKLSDIDKYNTRSKRRSIFQKVFAGTGAAAAAILIFFVASTPVSENTNTQKSSFFTDLVTTATPESNAKTDVVVESVEKTEDLSLHNSQPKVKVVAPKVNKETAKPVLDIESSTTSTSNNYYIIVGGATSDGEADRLIKNIKAKGLNKVETLNTRNRIRIYVASFPTMNEANQYLTTFKQKYPELSDAWVYIRN